jgi:hypothetical protein
MASLGAELYISTRRTVIAVITVAGLVVAFITWWMTPSRVVDARWVIICATLAIVVGVIFFDTAFRLNQRSALPLPAVKAVLKPPASYRAPGPLLLLEPHPLFSHNAAVSISSTIDGFEIMIGLGRVMTIQQDGRVQVIVVQKEDSPHGDIWARIESDLHTAQALIVRPYYLPLNSWIEEIPS